MRRAKIQTEDGTILRAYLHSPGPGAHPGMIMCPGFGGVKPLIDTYAALFAEAGFAVLNHDQRGFGKLQSPKNLLTFDGGHFDAYTMFFEQTEPPARDWFVEHLGMPRGRDAPGARESVSSTISN